MSSPRIRWVKGPPGLGDLSSAQMVKAKADLMIWGQSAGVSPPLTDYGLNLTDVLAASSWTQRDGIMLHAFAHWWNGSGKTPVLNEGTGNPVQAALTQAHYDALEQFDDGDFDAEAAAHQILHGEAIDQIRDFAGFAAANVAFGGRAGLQADDFLKFVYRQLFNFFLLDLMNRASDIALNERPLGAHFNLAQVNRRFGHLHVESRRQVRLDDDVPKSHGLITKE